MGFWLLGQPQQQLDGALSGRIQLNGRHGAEGSRIRQGGRNNGGGDGFCLSLSGGAGLGASRPAGCFRTSQQPPGFGAGSRDLLLSRFMGGRQAARNGPFRLPNLVQG